jgi:hypothetical protein
MSPQMKALEAATRAVDAVYEAEAIQEKAKKVESSIRAATERIAAGKSLNLIGERPAGSPRLTNEELNKSPNSPGSPGGKVLNFNIYSEEAESTNGDGEESSEKKSTKKDSSTSSGSNGENGNSSGDKKSSAEEGADKEKDAVDPSTIFGDTTFFRKVFDKIRHYFHKETGKAGEEEKNEIVFVLAHSAKKGNYLPYEFPEFVEMVESAKRMALSPGTPVSDFLFFDLPTL